MLEGVRAVQASCYVEASSPRGWLPKRWLVPATRASPKLCVRHEMGNIHVCKVKTERLSGRRTLLPATLLQSTTFHVIKILEAIGEPLGGYPFSKRPYH